MPGLSSEWLSNLGGGVLNCSSHVRLYMLGTAPLEGRGLHIFTVIVNIAGFENYMESVSDTQLCGCSTKAATNNI